MPTTTPHKPAAKAPLTAAERKELIFRRRRESFFWYAVATLGSLKFAVFLLLSIAVIIGTATVVESVYDTPVALYYIYNSPWFILWLFALCINLAAAALSRWPWQRKHTGFVVTHLGIICMLIGSVIGMVWGFEGYVTLRTDGPAAESLHARDTVLRFATAADGGIDQTGLPVEVLQPTPESPLVEPLPPSDLELVITGYSEQLQQAQVLVPSGDPSAQAGLDLVMNSAMMGQQLELPMLVDPEGVSTQPLFTLAKIELHPRFGPKEEIGQPEPVDFTQLTQADLFREMHVILARHPEEPIITSDTEQPTGYRFSLEKDEASELGFDLVMKNPAGREERWPLEKVLGRASAAANGSLQVVVAEYWPDFDISSGRPESKSDQPNNPAVRIEVFGARASMEPPKPTLQLTPAEGGEAVAYRLLRDNKIVGEGTLKQGDVLPLGWADWHLTLREILPKATLAAALRESTMAANPSSMGETPRVTRGILAALRTPDGRMPDPMWLPAGRTMELVAADGRTVPFWFGPRIIPLDFSVKLESFEVPRDEGTDQPADFISTLAFTGPESGGEVVRGEAHMNEPAMYPGGFWRSVMGMNYKFSQAGWDRNDLDKSSLQVLYDPGWPLKWFGSLCICLGIFMLFYMRGYGREVSEKPEKRGPEQKPEGDVI